MARFRLSTGKARRTKQMSPFKAVVSAAHGPSQFEAEVTSVRRGNYGAYFLGLQRTSDGVNISAILSAQLTIPKEGDMVVVRGGFEENPKAKTIPKPVRLRIASITPLGRQAIHHVEGSEALRSALVGHVPMKETRTIRRPVIVTGRNTDVEHDIRKVLAKAEYLEPGFPMFEDVDLGSPESIAAGVRRSALVPDVRAIVLARGGTSEKWQFHPFSHPAVIRAVADVAKSIPVVVAIGHENDHPLCEQVASFVVSAPSAVGELFNELNRARNERLLHDAVDVPHEQLRAEQAVREAYAPALRAPAPAEVESNAPQNRTWLRRRWLAALTVAGVLAIMGGGALVVRMQKAPVVELPSLQSQSAPVAPTPPPPPVAPATTTRRRQKPARKPLEKAAPASNVSGDAGLKVPPAATAAPQMQTPIDVFE